MFRGMRGHSKFTNIDLILELSGETVTVGLLLAPAPFDTPPGTTIINSDMIRRLPIQK